MDIFYIFGQCSDSILYIYVICKNSRSSTTSKKKLNEKYMWWYSYGPGIVKNYCPPFTFEILVFDSFSLFVSLFLHREVDSEWTEILQTKIKTKTKIKKTNQKGNHHVLKTENEQTKYRSTSVPEFPANSFFFVLLGSVIVFWWFTSNDNDE